jgi:molybdopterin synthase sulfur carrier subunit
VVRVLLFGRLADIAGWRERTVDPAPPTLSALRAQIAGDFPDLAEALAGRGVQAAVNKVIARGDMALATGAEVAFLPPMSGG